MVPWRGRALFGTWESSCTCDPADTAVREADVEAFIAELNEAFPSLELSQEDVTLVHRGVVPAAVGADGRTSLEGHDVVRDENAGLISVAGTKYTTARAVGQRIVDAVIEKLRRTTAPCRTADTPLPGGDLPDQTLAVADAHRHAGGHLPGDVITHLLSAYGSRYGGVAQLAATRSEWCARLADDLPVIGAQLVWAVREEMAVTLADAMIRRTPLGALGYPGDAPSARAAAIVGAELGWSDARARDEIEDVRRFYRRPD
jgi:glycerol-3-phosphate dehydrogenase